LAVPVLAACILAFHCTGCGGPRPTAAPVPIPGYESLQEQLYGRDLTPLRQRRVVLDPGHGGHFRGAIGPNGLAEADVNLGVALQLRGLLEWAGTEVWLTRSADTDFLTPADSSLSSDLAMRVSLSDSLQPDVFVSIHHNSNAALDRTINETQTYYPLDDDGASLDLARSIHRHLVVNLEIQPASIRPGNFHVLRNATVPAVLGEPAMISHPVMAKRLSLAASQRLEAEAYFLGLLDYFGDGLPVWSGAPSDTVYWGSATDPSQLSWSFLPLGTQEAAVSGPAPGPDPSQTRLLLDGQPVMPQLSPDGRTVTWPVPPTLPLRPHLLELRGRNLAGRATPRRQTVLLPRAATALEVTATFEADTERGALHWRGIDGAPVASGSLQLAPGRSISVGPGHPTWVLRDDLATFWQADAVTWRAADGAGDDQACVVTEARLASGRRLHLVTHAGRPFAPRAGWRGRLGVRGTSPLVIRDLQQAVWLEGPGVQPLIDPQPGVADIPRTVAATSDTWEAASILAGLAGKVIVLDPAGGGVLTDGAGPLGTRGADLNLEVARHAAALLRGAGARVHLSRDDETALLPVEKVRLAGRVNADLFLTIGRHTDLETRVVRHHPGSPVGRLWAQAAVRASALLPAPAGGLAPACRTEESSAYLLRHTACPALEWRLEPPLTPAEELRQIRPGWHRAEARAILLAISAISGHPAVFDHLLQPAEILDELVPYGGLPATEVDWALLDGNLAWTPLPPAIPVGAAVDFVDSDQGPGLPGLQPHHVLEIHAGPRWQIWRLDRLGSTWQPILLLGASSPGS
jgi:N-acetylmuramoyl-L-alanine amidase